MIMIVAFKTIFADTSESTVVDANAVIPWGNWNTWRIRKVIIASSSHNLSRWDFETCFCYMIPDSYITVRSTIDELDTNRNCRIPSRPNANDSRCYCNHSRHQLVTPVIRLLTCL